MRHRWRHAAVACVLCACGSDSEAEDVAITVLVTEVTSDEPDPDTEVCVVVPTGYGCATTGADGRVTLNVPASSDVVFRSTRSDRMTGLFAYTSGDAPEEIEVDTADPTLAQVLLLGAGVEAQEGMGQVLLLARGPTGSGAEAEGMTFSLGVGDGPFYFGGSQPMPELTETTSDGAVAFANVPPGEHTITAAGAASCVTRVGFDRGVDRTGFRVEAGALTFVRLVDCAPR
ncbi:MAG: hypothetical protein H6721_32035 [Sandaracinus sp.]|nr:hypothetical protein [Myxococcales bacterium]MCB9612462.1 hypothetical protein [Sandaracinus sp.]MCB9636765.1 hypothetical protein [Sandaracinus sp.]